MAVKLKGLDRGLDALLMPEPTRVDAPAAGVTALKVADMIAGKYQPRRRFDDALARRAVGVDQGAGHPCSPSSLEKLAARGQTRNHRRRTSLPRGATGGPRRSAGDRQSRRQDGAHAALIENLQRQDLNAIEEAHGLQRLIAEFSFTHEQAAEAVGKSRSAVSNPLRLLETTAPRAGSRHRRHARNGHARALATLPKDKQVMLAEKIAINDLSVRATEALVKEESSATGKRPGVPTAKSKQGKLICPPRATRIWIAWKLSSPTRWAPYVSIVHQSGGQGELVIRYASLDQLDGLSRA